MVHKTNAISSTEQIPLTHKIKNIEDVYYTSHRLAEIVNDFSNRPLEGRDCLDAVAVVTTYVILIKGGTRLSTDNANGRILPTALNFKLSKTNSNEIVLSWQHCALNMLVIGMGALKLPKNDVNVMWYCKIATKP